MEHSEFKVPGFKFWVRIGALLRLQKMIRSYDYLIISASKLLLRNSFDCLLSDLKPTIVKAYTNKSIPKGRKSSTDISFSLIALIETPMKKIRANEHQTIKKIIQMHVMIEPPVFLLHHFPFEFYRLSEEEKNSCIVSLC
ncbi:hypothetical protein CQ022_19630 [Chryseobacterium culicis]|uniref:Uncharacterized protein n=1 Tax=Chryseobacterium culicis TaxID=680127 RepID=A0A2S9CN10_CHRCI|nr:hypothetical protein CQ022_19630 [Chryseobacterium culicis]PRB88535.1 hypothetical protein CQ033_18535 [Chryseobacterium culicis]